MEASHVARLLIVAARRAGTLNASALRSLYDPGQPRDEQGQWTAGSGASAHFNVPENFKLEDAEYDVNTKLPLDTMVFATVDLDLLSSEYKNDFRVREMAKAMEQGAKFPPLTLEQRSNGKLAILDGRTRVAAFREAGLKGKIPAVIRLEDRGTEGALPKGVVIDRKRTDSLRAGVVRHAQASEGALHAAADAHVPAVAVALRHAFAEGRKALRGTTLQANPVRNVDKAVAAIRRALGATLPGTLRRVLIAGGQVAAGTLQTAENFRAAKRSDKTKVDFAFDADNQAAVDWADRHAAELIDGITETSREAINNAIADALETGDLADALDEILAAVGDAYRAALIARHETMLAVSEGQRQAWGQAVEDGWLTGDEERQWIATGDAKVCPVCDALDGQTAPLGGSYESDGESYDGPPAHVSCRCTEGIVG